MRSEFRGWRRDTGMILTSPSQRALIALAAVFPLRFTCFSVVVALHATATMGAGPKEVGLMFTAMALSQGLGMPVGAYLADKVQGAKTALVLPAGLLSCAAFASLAYATELPHFLGAMACQGLAAAFVQPAVGAYTAEITPADKRGQAMSLQRQAQSVIGLIAPVSFGALADFSSCPTAVLLSAGLMGMCHLPYALLPHRPRESAESAESSDSASASK